MNKAQLAEEIAKKGEISKNKAYQLLNITTDAIKASLKKGKGVSLIGFGSFIVRKRKARMGRNPQTGASIKIKAAKVPAFKPGSAFKKALN